MTVDVTFRRAAAPDLHAIVGLLYDDALGRTRERLSDPLDQAYLAAFEAVDADPNQLLAVGEAADGAIVACLQLSFIPGLSHLGLWRGQIESVRVASDRRGQGLGERLFEWAIETCRARGCGLVQLTTNAGRAEAQRFYERLGFEASHVGYKLDLR